MGKSKKSWENRLSGQPDPLTVDFVQSLSCDKRLYNYDIVGSIAHAQMLAEQGARVIDSDRVAHAVMLPGGPAHGAVVEAFGTGILSEAPVPEAELSGVRVLRG